MSASHSKELPGTVSELVGRRFRIVPGVGLVDRDVLLTHVFDPSLLLGVVQVSPRIDLLKVSEDGFRIRVGTRDFSFGARFLDDVALGYERVQSARANLHAAARRILGNDSKDEPTTAVGVSSAFIYTDFVLARPATGSRLSQVIQQRLPPLTDGPLGSSLPPVAP